MIKLEVLLIVKEAVESWTMPVRDEFIDILDSELQCSEKSVRNAIKDMEI